MPDSVEMPAPESITTSPSATSSASCASCGAGTLSTVPCCHSRHGVAPPWDAARMQIRCAVLLRGVNVGKHNRVAMADLRRVLTSLGLTEVTTYLQSGNAVVTGEPDGLAERVEQALASEL